MLIFSRKRNESVVIQLPDGRTVKVMVTAIEAGQGRCRLGVEAPRDVAVRMDDCKNRRTRSGCMTEK